MSVKSDDVKARIESLHKKGLLLARITNPIIRVKKVFHPYEHWAEGPPRTNGFFDVLAGVVGAEYEGYHHDAKTSDNGLHGVSTTVLHSEFPVQLWIGGGPIGLLFDGNDSQNIRLDYFSPYDSYSGYKDGVMMYPADINDNIRNAYPEIMEPQKRPLSGKKPTKRDDYDDYYEFNLTKADPVATRKAIKDYWALMSKNDGWNKHIKKKIGMDIEYPELNETTVTAKMPAVLGVVIDVQWMNELAKNAEELPRWMRLKSPPVTRYDIMQEAAEMAHMLKEKYPEAMAKNHDPSEEYLPIVLYDREKDQKLEFIPPEKVAEMAQDQKKPQPDQYER